MRLFLLVIQLQKLDYSEVPHYDIGKWLIFNLIYIKTILKRELLLRSGCHELAVMSQVVMESLIKAHGGLTRSN